MSTYRIKDIAEINPTFIRNGVDLNSVVSFVPMAAVSEITCSIVLEEFRPLKDVVKGYTYFSKDDILLAKITPCFENGKLAIATISTDIGFGTTEFHVIRPKKNVVETKYLYYFLRNPKFRKLAEKRMTGSAGQKRIPKDYIANLTINLPELDEQKRVVEILDKLAELIQKRHQTVETLDKFLQSVFYEMFGDPIKNEKGWEVKQLKDISSKILSGNTPKGGRQVYVENWVLFLRSQNVWRNRLDLDDVAYISEDTHSKMKNSSLEHKDLLMTKTGRINTENSSLGRAAIYLGENNRANVNGHVYLIRLKKDAVHEFVLFILTTNEYRDYIRSVCVGGIDKRQINKIHLEEFPIISPPIALQMKFAALANKIYEKRNFYLKSEQKMENLFNSLLQQSFSEEVNQYAI